MVVIILDVRVIIGDRGVCCCVICCICDPRRGLLLLLLILFDSGDDFSVAFSFVCSFVLSSVEQEYFVSYSFVLSSVKQE